MDNLRKIREKRNITQLRLGTEIDVTQETISAYESGKTMPSVESLVKMADFLNTSTDYLLGRINKDNSLIDLSNDIVDKKLEALLNNYAKLNDLQRNDLIWYSEIVENKKFK